MPRLFWSLWSGLVLSKRQGYSDHCDIRRLISYSSNDLFFLAGLLSTSAILRRDTYAWAVKSAPTRENLWSDHRFFPNRPTCRTEIARASGRHLHAPICFTISRIFVKLSLISLCKLKGSSTVEANVFNVSRHSSIDYRNKSKYI